MPLIEIAVLSLPTKEEAENGALETIILEPTAIIANDGQSAAMAVVIDFPEKFKDVDRSRMQVLTRPFAKI